jgi:hypothetical protein
MPMPRSASSESAKDGERAKRFEGAEAAAKVPLPKLWRGGSSRRLQLGASAMPNEKSIFPSTAVGERPARDTGDHQK